MVSRAQYHRVEAYSERRKYFGLANERRRAVLIVGLSFLALGNWATDGCILYLRARHLEVTSVEA